MNSFVEVDHDDPYSGTVPRHNYQSTIRKTTVSTQAAFSESWLKNRIAIVNLEDSIAALRDIGETQMSKTLQLSCAAISDICDKLEDMSMEKHGKLPAR
jgi:hypothetical protein